MPIIPGVSASSDGRQPTAPIIGTALAGNNSATVAFTGPEYFGKPSTNNLYVALSSPESITGSSTSSPISVTGLSNGTAYTFTVTAQTRNTDSSVIAISAASSPSNSVTPVAPPPPPVVPPVVPPVLPPKGSQPAVPLPRVE